MVEVVVNGTTQDKANKVVVCPSFVASGTGGVSVLGSQLHVGFQESLSWNNKVTMVKERWVPITGKNSKKSPPQLDMTFDAKRRGVKEKLSLFLFFIGCGLD